MTGGRGERRLFSRCTFGVGRMESRVKARVRWTVGAGAALVLAITVAGTATGQAPLGKTTVEQRIVPDAEPSFRSLTTGPGEPYIVREEGIGTAQAGRAEPPPLAALLRPALRLPARRRGVAGAGRVHRHRPVQRRLAAVGGAEPADRRRDDPPAERVRRGQPGRRRRRLAAARWTSRSTPATSPTASSSTRPSGCGRCSRAARSNPGSGVDPATSDRPALRRRARRGSPTRRRRRTTPGVQDYDDYVEGATPQFYDPDTPAGAFADLARLPGPDGPRPAAVPGRRARRALLRRVRQPRRARAGQRGRQRRLRARRDRLRQADLAGGHRPDTLAGALAALDPADLPDLLGDPDNVALVPARPEAPVRLQGAVQGRLPRRHPGRRPRLRLRRPGRGGGLGRRRRLLRLEPEAGLPLHLARHGLRGRRDRPVGRRQHRRPAVPAGCEGELEQATDARRAGRPVQPPRDPEPDRRRPRRGRAAVHRPPTRTATTPTPAATSTRAAPRRSTSAPTSRQLLHRVPARDRLGRRPLARQQRRALREARAAAASGASASPPRPTGRSRAACSRSSTTRDGTLSIFGTIVDHASAATAPRGRHRRRRPRRRASSPRSAARSPTTTPSRRPRLRRPRAARATPKDRNVELLVADPRREPRRGWRRPLREPAQGDAEARPARGTAGGDRLRGRAGNDRLSGKAGETASRAAAATTGSSGGGGRTSSRAAAAATGSRAAAVATSSAAAAAPTGSISAAVVATRSAAVRGATG